MDQNLTTKTRILLIEDDQNARKTLNKFLDIKGYSVVAAGSGHDGLALHDDNPANIALIDLKLPDIPGIAVLEKLKASHPSTQVIILTANTALETAVECMKSGACDYLTKPIVYEKLFAALERARELLIINEEVNSFRNTPLPDKLANESFFSPIVTNNREMRELFRYMEAIASSHQAVLITGETGVGKELFAQAIHRISRSPGLFIAVNVAGLDDTVFSDTLFGHKRGAFTGANDFREGLVCRASEGTLFLDEIGDLAEKTQIKLLRLIQEREYYRLGTDTPTKSSARLVLATNRDLRDLMQKGIFRKDLFYRLNTHPINIPPLRKRPDDIPLLLEHFVDLAARSLGKPAPSYPPELVTLLATYDYPGNVRELQAMLFDMVARNSSGKLSLDGFKSIIQRERADGSDANHTTNILMDKAVSFNRFPTLKEAETELINRALELAKGNQGIAASLLGISRQALNNRLRRSS